MAVAAAATGGAAGRRAGSTTRINRSDSITSTSGAFAALLELETYDQSLIVPQDHRAQATPLFHMDTFFEQAFYQIGYPVSIPFIWVIRGSAALHNMRFICSKEQSYVALFQLLLNGSVFAMLALLLTDMQTMRMSANVVLAYFAIGEVTLALVTSAFQRGAVSTKWAYVPREQYVYAMKNRIPFQALQQDQIMNSWISFHDDKASTVMDRELFLAQKALGIDARRVCVRISEDKLKWLEGALCKLTDVGGTVQEVEDEEEAHGGGALGRARASSGRSSALGIPAHLASPPSAAAATIPSRLAGGRKTAVNIIAEAMDSDSSDGELGKMSPERQQQLEAERDGLESGLESGSGLGRGSLAGAELGVVVGILADAKTAPGSSSRLNGAYGVGGSGIGSGTGGYDSRPVGIVAGGRGAGGGANRVASAQGARSVKPSLRLSTISTLASPTRPLPSGKVFGGDSPPMRGAPGPAHVHVPPLTGAAAAAAGRGSFGRMSVVAAKLPLPASAVSGGSAGDASGGGDAAPGGPQTWKKLSAFTLAKMLIWRASRSQAQASTTIGYLTFVACLMGAFIPLVVRAACGLPVFGETWQQTIIFVLSVYTSFWLSFILSSYLRAAILDARRRADTLTRLGELAMLSDPRQIRKVARGKVTSSTGRGNANRGSTAALMSAPSPGSAGDRDPRFSAVELGAVNPLAVNAMRDAAAAGATTPASAVASSGGTPGGGLGPARPAILSNVPQAAEPRIGAPVVPLDSVDNVVGWHISRRMLRVFGLRYFMRMQAYTSQALVLTLLILAGVLAVTLTGFSAVLSSAAIGFAAVALFYLALLSSFIVTMLVWGARANFENVNHCAMLSARMLEAKQAAAAMRRSGEREAGEECTDVAEVLQSVIDMIRVEDALEPQRILGVRATFGLLQAIAVSLLSAVGSAVNLLRGSLFK